MPFYVSIHGEGRFWLFIFVSSANLGQQQWIEHCYHMMGSHLRLDLLLAACAGEFVKNFRTYVKREIQHQSSLRHPFIIGLTEVGDVLHERPQVRT